MGARRTLLILLAAMAGMGGLVAGSVPLYRLFCAATGYGGTPRVAAGASAPGAAADAPTVTVRFNADTYRDLPWEFRPGQGPMPVRLGEPALATFTARNLSDEAMVGIATFNVTPAKAAPHVTKVACFCFSEQRLEPGQSATLPLSFHIDPALATDREAGEVETITLSYTFFRAQVPQ